MGLGLVGTGSSAPRPPGEVTDGGLRVVGDRETSRSPSCDLPMRSDGRGVEPREHARQPRRGGNLFGNPGVTISRYRRTLDEISPAPEQPGWSWAGPVGRLRSDS